MGLWQFVTPNSDLIGLGHTGKAAARAKKDYAGRERQTQTDCPTARMETVVERAQIEAQVLQVNSLRCYIRLWPMPCKL